ncbi:MAG: bifunctional tRNA (5-methylaminomethyl-2-thiouridine)(34)-methyltransferase MnmD/FAD-dependent 5-carboxymethylaminomethyl-2-thiouridine(34) oxidoreductase MnmC [Pseudomonadota bacterium]
MPRRIDTAKLEWSAGAPHAARFDDIYFSGDGQAETAHVFLAGNDLPARFSSAQRFAIGELGFGTGLNVLCAWDLWRGTEKPPSARLHIVSIEKYPLADNDLARAHCAWPALAPLAETLRAALPPRAPGFHALRLDADVLLTLFYGDALDGLRAAEASVDAWFLDGFSPAKNPEMWRPELFSEMARLSSPGATAATFTVAGAVRRGLMAAGFAVEKRPGFGAKRDMLTARIETPRNAPLRAPWFQTANAKRFETDARIAIIGAGIAGASLAHSLRAEGFTPIVYDGAGPAAGASGNPAGLIMPRLDLDDTPAARFSRAAYLQTIRLLKTLPETVFISCGALLRATSQKERERHIALAQAQVLPEGWMELCENGLFFPQGGVVDPSSYVAALLCETELRAEDVNHIEQDGDRWRVETSRSKTCFDAIVIANAMDAKRFDATTPLPLSASAGQIDLFPQAAAPEHAIAFGPYAAPAPKGGLIVGATYAPAAIGEEPRFSLEATQTTLDAVARTLPDLVNDLDPAASISRAAIRCTTPDRLPVAGAVPDWDFYARAYEGLRTGRREDYPPAERRRGLYALTGLGSRGLVAAPLAAAIIAADIAGAPSPVEQDVAEALDPARFFIRNLKRGKA